MFGFFGEYADKCTMCLYKLELAKFLIYQECSSDFFRQNNCPDAKNSFHFFEWRMVNCNFLMGTKMNGQSFSQKKKPSSIPANIWPTLLYTNPMLSSTTKSMWHMADKALWTKSTRCKSNIENKISVTFMMIFSISCHSHLAYSILFYYTNKFWKKWNLKFNYYITTKHPSSSYQK